MEVLGSGIIQVEQILLSFLSSPLNRTAVYPSGRLPIQYGIAPGAQESPGHLLVSAFACRPKSGPSTVHSTDI